MDTSRGLKRPKIGQKWPKPWHDTRYREYHAKSHQRKQHISVSRNDNLVLKKVPGRTFKPILSVLDKQIGFWKNNLHWKNEICSIFEKNHRF